MRIELDTLGTGPEGLEIGVRGFMDSPDTDPNFPSQIYIEVYEGKLRVHVWDGSSENPVSTTEIAPLLREQVAA
jgi:hypothetical protein